MSFLKLSWCSLIKIILSQIGGNPLQQIYTQLNQGKPTMAPGGILPSGLAELKNFIEGAVQVVNAAQQAAGNFSDTLERMATEFYQNPIGSITGTTMTNIDTRVAFIQGRLDAEAASPGTLTAQEIASYTSEKTFLVGSNGLGGLKNDLQVYLDNTDRLVGLKTQTSSSQSGCSIQDLLGSGCTPNEDVPDVDIKALVESLKRGDAIAAVAEKIKNATGVSDLETALASFKAETQSFNNSFLNRVNKASVRNAVTGQITQIVFNLLSGCGNNIFDLTLKPGVKTAIGPYVAAMEQQRSGQAYFDGNGDIVTTPPQESTTTVPKSDVTVDVTLGTKAPQKYYLNGIEVSKERYDQAAKEMDDSYRNSF